MLKQLKVFILQRLNLALMSLALRIGRRNGAKAPLKDASSILVIRLDGIGDVVMTTPLLRELRRNCPKANITLIVNVVAKNMLQHCPYVDRVIGFDMETGCRPRQLGLFLRAKKLVKANLSTNKFDWVLLPRWDCEPWGAGYLALLSGAREQAAYSEHATPDKSIYNKGHDRFFSNIIADAHCHEIEHNLNMLKSLGLSVVSKGVELWVDDSSREWARKRLGRNSEDNIITIALCPGAARPQKIWPLEYFIALVSELLSHSSAIQIIVLGGKAERIAGRRILERFPKRVIDLTARTSLLETAAILEQSDLCIGNDTGALHIAAAVGTPQLMICSFSKEGAQELLNSPHRFGPRNHTFILQPVTAMPPCVGSCHSSKAHCITQIGVPEVFDRALGVLGHSGSNP